MEGLLTVCILLLIIFWVVGYIRYDAKVATLSTMGVIAISVFALIALMRFGPPLMDFLSR